MATVLANKSNNPKPGISGFCSEHPLLGQQTCPCSRGRAISRIINYDRILEIGKQFYGNAKDFTFYFVGNYDEKTLLPLIEQYIASSAKQWLQAEEQADSLC